MSSPTIHSVAIDVVGQYGLVGKNLLAAYQAGTQRVVSQLNERYSAVIGSPSLPLVDASIRDSLVAAHRQLTGFVVDGVSRVVEGADAAIDRVTEGATQGIQRLGEAGQRIEAVVGAPFIDTVTQLNLPAAQISLQIAGGLAEGSRRLAERVAGVEEAVVAEAAEATPRSRRASAKA